MAKRLTRFIAGAVLALSAQAVLAQSFPSKPIRAIIPYGPGTGVDVVARMVGEGIARNLGQTFIAEQKVGAAGTIAAAFVASAPGDGYTLLFDSSAHTSVPALMQNLPFDTARDFSGVTTLIENPLVLVTGQSRGYKAVADLVAAGKARPGSINFASGGIGTSTHISAEKFRMAAGFEAVHVPFKSTTEAITEILGGRMDFTYTALTTALAGVRDGRLVALAMSARRSSVLPNVPTITEAGFANATYSSWVGMMVSSKTPRDIVNRIYQETVKVLAQPDIQERLAKIGAEPNTMTPDEFDALRRRELVENVQLMKATGIKTQ
jgi:tripartite-type tricarboxylate transporter receptor subunit TctC